MSQRDQHPTTEQLSTWLDQQLAAEEQASCSAHLEGCEQCQYMLNNLQQTVNLLRSLPQFEVPRSFALPADFQISANRNQRQRVEQATTTSPHRLPTPLRRTLRAVSALAAVIGLFFALSGLVAPLQPLSSAPTGTSSVSTSPTANLPPSPQSQQAPQLTSRNTSDGSSNVSNKGDSKQQTTKTKSTATESTPPLDFNQSEERLFIGIPLAIVGSAGFVLFAQRQKPRTRPAKRN